MGRLLMLGTGLGLVLALSGCGDDGGPVDAGGVDSGGVDSGGVDSGGVDSGGVDSGGVDSGGVDSGGDDGGGTDGAVDDAGSDAGPDDAGMTNVEITVTEAAAWANCMPVVPPDPLRFFVTLSYDNSAGSSAATAVIRSAKLTFDDPGTTVTDIELDVSMVSIPAGGTMSQMHTKTTSSPVVGSCGICSMDRMVTYELDIAVDGVPVPVSGTTSFGCTF